MKKYLIIILSAISIGFLSFAQSTNTNIKGELNISYNTRNGSGSTDTYTLNVNICNSAVFRGNIVALPPAKGTLSDTPGSLTYNLECDVVNPRNPSHSLTIGKLFGVAPIDNNNVYRYTDGNVKMSIFSVGTAKGFDSKFTGLALGKPPANTSLFNKVKQQTLSFTKSVGGKTVGISVTKYDKMEFHNHVVGGGPVQIYPDVTFNGNLIYDYARSAWYFQNILAVYVVDGVQKADKITGNIRWVESPNRKKTGEGEYQFDIRVNEPLPTEANIFAGTQDEASFFDTDTSIPALTGSMKYRDIMTGDTVTNSKVTINLQGNKLTKQQVMYLGKMLMLSSIVPFNAE